jgi:hypothetical protein
MPNFVTANTYNLPKANEDTDRMAKVVRRKLKEAKERSLARHSACSAPVTFA